MQGVVAKHETKQRMAFEERERANVPARVLERRGPHRGRARGTAILKFMHVSGLCIITS
jgi:hypothetical protein